jgi:hypothetical protein
MVRGAAIRDLSPPFRALGHEAKGGDTLDRDGVRSPVRER